jgi:mRNA-degrading endonuclease RelE of RelBE toxin-antitoxin system
MDKIQKLLMKISSNDRQKLLETVKKLISGDKVLDIKKIKNTDFYRTKSGKFRIIYHKEKDEIIIDSIKMRNEKTYKF